MQEPLTMGLKLGGGRIGDPSPLATETDWELGGF